EEVERRIALAQSGFETLRGTTFAERAQWLRRAADLLDAEAEGTARLLVVEMGKPIAQAEAEVRKSAKGLRFYADHAEEFLRSEEVDRRIALAQSGFETLRGTTFAERAQWLRRAAGLLDAEAEGTARLLVVEMGKPIAQAEAEVRKSAKGLRFYADHAEEFL